MNNPAMAAAMMSNPMAVNSQIVPGGGQKKRFLQNRQFALKNVEEELAKENEQQQQPKAKYSAKSAAKKEVPEEEYLEEEEEEEEEVIQAPVKKPTKSAQSASQKRASTKSLQAANPKSGARSQNLMLMIDRPGKLAAAAASGMEIFKEYNNSTLVF